MLLAFFLVAGCADDGGGGSGVDSAKQIKDLTPDEIMSECEWGVEAQGGPGHMTTCGDNGTVTVDTVAECADEVNGYKAGCTATVAQLEACLSGDPCSFGGPACTPIFACFGQ